MTTMYAATIELDYDGTSEKVDCIRIVRALTGASLRAAKGFVEGGQYRVLLTAEQVADLTYNTGAVEERTLRALGGCRRLLKPAADYVILRDVERVESTPERLAQVVAGCR